MIATKHSTTIRPKHSRKFNLAAFLHICEGTPAENSSDIYVTLYGDYAQTL
ncbi:hypothetical protein [Asticcacaulis sp.]|uniref:hypothetical protein n=1 Tax=Asticcacaulis sp. TaxID=1872648 RepID=UPI003F7B8DF0|nr:hypothetical protein [Asticcacaulis sp.]